MYQIPQGVTERAYSTWSMATRGRGDVAGRPCGPYTLGQQRAKCSPASTLGATWRRVMAREGDGDPTREER